MILYIISKLNLTDMDIITFDLNNSNNAVLFLQDSVYNIQSACTKLSYTANIYVLNMDLITRNIKLDNIKLNNIKIHKINYQEFVSLIVKYKKNL